jgi:diacylglycerol kinase (ATP)
MPHAVIVYNPAAGRYPSRMLVERAGSVLQNAGWKVSLDQSNDGEHISSLAHQAAANGVDYFLVAGGDGSLNEALPGLVGSQTALGVLPAGTANVWAQELGLPGLSWTRWLALEESAGLLTQGEVIQVDVGLCNQRHFLLWAGVGLDAFIVHRIEPRQPWEKHFAVVQYAASVVWHAAKWQGVNLRVEVDGETMEGHFLLALVSNVHLYAGGYATLSPEARLNDGKMDLWLFEGETLGDTVQIFLELLSQQHTQSPRVYRKEFQRLVMRSESPAFVQVDGEPFDTKSPVHIEVLPKALRVLVPATSPHPLLVNPL